MNNGRKKFTLNVILLRISIAVFYVSIAAFFLFLPRFKDAFIKESSLTVYSFAGLFSQDTIEDFEKHYDVKVSVKFFDSNEELLAKFKIGGGDGYDIVTSSDYMVQLLHEEKLLHILDHKKLSVIKELDSRLLGRYFDTENRYSVPLAWMSFGLLFNKKIFLEVPEEMSLDLIFKDPIYFADQVRVPYKISMRDDYRESVLLAGLYLFGKTSGLNQEQLFKIKELLIRQKKWVENYLHQDLGYFFLSDIIHVAIADSSYAKKIMELSDEFSFKIPKEGSFLSIENIAIPAKSKNIDLAYKFINFMLSKDAQFCNALVYGLNPSNKTVYKLIDTKFLHDPNFFPEGEAFNALHLLSNDFLIEELEEIWLAVKGA